MSILPNMRLGTYLASVAESEAAFAIRAGLEQRTVNRVAAGLVKCRIDIANKIVRASHARPTPSGGVVTFEELVPAETAA